MSPDELGFLHDPGRLINDGILLDVHIGRRPTPREPEPPLVEQKALIDTGAQDCYIDDDLARTLQLDLRGSAPVGRVHDVLGPQQVWIYSTLIVIDRFGISLHDPCAGYKIQQMSPQAAQASPSSIHISDSLNRQEFLSFTGKSN